MIKRKLWVLSLTTLLCSCEISSLPTSSQVQKDINALVCYGGDKTDINFGQSFDEIVKKVDAKKDNRVKLNLLELGENGANYSDLLDYKINEETYDYIFVVGEKANLFLANYIKTNQGISFITIDSKSDTIYQNVANYEFAPEEVGYIASTLIENQNNVGYLSTYDTTFDKKVLYGFMQGQEAQNKTSNIVLKYFEEEYNYEKTVDYTEDLFNKYGCKYVYENSKNNLTTIIEKALSSSSKIVSSNIDYLPNYNSMAKDAVSNILAKNYEKVLDSIVESITNSSLSFYETKELSYLDGFYSLKNSVDLEGKLNKVKKLESIEEYNSLYNKMVRDIESDYTPKYSVDIGYHEAIPNCGELNNWKHAPRYGADHGMKPTNWTAVGAWATIYAQEGFPRAKNTGIEFKNMRIWGYNETLGWKLIEWANPVGSFYDEDFVNDYHQDFPNNYFNDKANKTTRIKLDNSNIGFNYHPFSSQNDLASLGLSDLKYIVSTMDIRLVVWDDTRANDIQKAKYVANIGGDWWSYKGATWQPDWSANRDICVAQFRTITPNWKTLYMTNVPVDKYEQIIGQGEFLNQFE